MQLVKPKINQQIYSKITWENPITKFVYCFKYILGMLFSNIIKYYNDNQELKEIARIIECRSDGDRLNEDQLANLMSHQDSTFDLNLRKKYFKEADHKRTLHGIIIPHLEYILQSDVSIKNVLNIGCNYAYMDSILAKNHPKIQFIGVDVNKNLEQLNSDLLSKNLKVHAGYALDILEKGLLKPDLCYMSSTATVIRNAELKRYLRILSKVSKYVAFSEPIWLLPGNRVQNPSKVSIDVSKPGYIQRRPITNDYGYLCYIHNYKKLLEQAGFEPIVYKFYRPNFTYLYWVVIIGQNKNAKLWNHK